VGTFVTNPIAICHPFANLHQEASAASLYGSRHPITIPLLNYILHQPINPAPAFTKYLYIRYKPAKSTKLKNKLLKAVPVTYHDRSLETKFQIAGSCPGLATFPWFSTYWLHEHYVSGLHREKLEIEIDRRKIEIRVELVCPWRSWGHWSLIWNISAYQHPFFCSRWRKYFIYNNIHFLRYFRWNRTFLLQLHYNLHAKVVKSCQLYEHLGNLEEFNIFNLCRFCNGILQ